MWPNSQETANLVPFTEDMLNGKLHFLSSDATDKSKKKLQHGFLPMTLQS